MELKEGTMKHLFVRASQLLLIFVILGIPCLLSVTGGQQTGIVPIPFKEGDGILEGNQGVGTDELLQFVAGGHVLGFRERDVTIASGGHALRIEFVGSQSISPMDEGAFQNADISQENPRPLERVTYNSLWEGVTLVYEKHSSGVVKSTYIVQPSGTGNTSPVEHIRLRYNVPVTVAESGNLIFPFETGQMTESYPVAWQDINGDRIPVDVSFRALSEREVGFTVGSYNHNYPLVIDPTLSWMTFLGQTYGDVGNAIAVDGSGNTYVAGDSWGTWGSPVNPYVDSLDAFVAKLDNNGVLVWNTFMGAAVLDQGHSIALDGSGNIYVSGRSDNTWGTPIVAHSGFKDAFVAKLNNSGTLLWNTFMGEGTGYDYGWAIAVDGSGNVYVAGESYRSWGTPIIPHTGDLDAFAAKLNNSGTLQWNTFMGAAVQADRGYAIDVDGSGNVFVGGYSYVNWGTPVNPHTGFGYDGFIAKLNTNGSRLWNTFMGATVGGDVVQAITVDGSGNIFVAGESYATWGTPVNPFSGGTSDAFAAKLDNSGTLLWHTFMGGGTGMDWGMDIAVDEGGDIFVAGGSQATWGTPIFPYTGSWDAFAAQLNPDGVRLRHAFMGAADLDIAYGVAIDGVGDVYVTGESEGGWGAPLNAHAGGTDVFVTKFSRQDPEIDIKANGSDSTIIITQGEALSVIVNLDPRGLNGQDADWWILKKTSGSLPNQWYHFDYPSRSWMLGRSPTRQGGLFDVSSKKLPGTSGLAAGTYTFYFAIDMIMNGSIDVSAAYFDKVKVIIDP
jgi:outer membrane protein assembly factor BamB